MKGLAAAAPVLLLVLAACGASTAPDPRHPERPTGCGVKSYDASPPFPVDDLGVVEVDCTNNHRCGRSLADAVCLRGGDVVWGLGEDHPPNTKRGHAAHSSHGDYPERPKGCEVQVFPNAPTVNTENIGPVSARCADDVTDEDCLRTLKDEACALGADVVWGVGDPIPKNGKKIMGGRAAHTTAKPTAGH